jgi:hypothetical protein
MIEQVRMPVRGGEVVFADPDQGGFEIGAHGMGSSAWSACAWRIVGAPVKVGEASTVALHDGISVDYAVQVGLVKLVLAW